MSLRDVRQFSLSGFRVYIYGMVISFFEFIIMRSCLGASKQLGCVVGAHNKESIR